MTLKEAIIGIESIQEKMKLGWACEFMNDANKLAQIFVAWDEKGMIGKEGKVKNVLSIEIPWNILSDVFKSQGAGSQWDELQKRESELNSEKLRFMHLLINTKLQK
jgi:hypothetical protein